MNTSCRGARFPVLGLALLAFLPGCVLTSLTNKLSDPTFPEQEAEIAKITSDTAEVLIRAKDGTVEARRHATRPVLGVLREATVHHAPRRVMSVNPFAIFRDWRIEQSCYEVELKGEHGDATTDVKVLLVPPSTGEKVASYTLMPFCFLIDVALFPLEWIGLLVVR